MDLKSFRPLVVNPGASTIHEAYGIDEQRRIQISDAMDQMIAGFSGVVFMHTVLDKIADMCETREEYVWAITTHLMWMAAKGYLTNMNPRHLLRRGTPPTGN